VVGDIHGSKGFPDSRVDVRNVAAVAALFSVDYPEPDYSPNCDIVYDRKINMKDIVAVARR